MDLVLQTPIKGEFLHLEELEGVRNCRVIQAVKARDVQG